MKKTVKQILSYAPPEHRTSFGWWVIYAVVVMLFMDFCDHFYRLCLHRALDFIALAVVLYGPVGRIKTFHNPPWKFRISATIGILVVVLVVYLFWIFIHKKPSWDLVIVLLAIIPVGVYYYRLQNQEKKVD